MIHCMLQAQMNTLTYSVTVRYGKRIRMDRVLLLVGRAFTRIVWTMWRFVDLVVGIGPNEAERKTKMVTNSVSLTNESCYFLHKKTHVRLVDRLGLCLRKQNSWKLRLRRKHSGQ